MRLHSSRADSYVAMTLRHACLWAGEEALKAKLLDLAMAMEPTGDEAIAAGYGV